MQLTITGYSTALFSTWYFIEELGLLLDCGDGLMAGLLQKSRKIEHVFLTHPDRDHLTGLLQFNQLNARAGLPIIYYPKDCGSIRALEMFSKQFDPHVSGTVWKPIIDREKVWIRKDIYVQAIKNSHVPCTPDVNKSFGYKVVQVRQKLKPEYLQLPPLEIKKMIEIVGKEDAYVEQETILLAYSGDTPVENFDQWDGAKVLIHEATFIGADQDTPSIPHANRHSILEQVLEAVSKIRVENLVLGHFSSRYSDSQIDEAIRSGCQKFGLTIPVRRVLPGILVRNVLDEGCSTQ